MPDDAALEGAARVRVTVLVGAGDTGKTTLAARLASALAARGTRVAVVDADVGQSEIGPPTTVGLGAVTGPLTRLRDAELVALEFIGDTSPVRRIGVTADATGRLVRRALAAGFAHVIVDTGGLVEGALGVALKRAKLRAIDPDLVILVQRRDESEPLARALGGAERPALVRVVTSPAATRRTQTQRRLFRDRALQEYLRDSASVRVPMERVEIARGPRGAAPTDIVEGLLVGIYNAAGETLGVGRVRSVDATSASIVVDTPVRPAQIARLATGRVVWPPARKGAGAHGARAPTPRRMLLRAAGRRAAARARGRARRPRTSGGRRGGAAARRPAHRTGARGRGRAAAARSRRRAGRRGRRRPVRGAADAFGLGAVAGDAGAGQQRERADAR
jgi:polynucleotide 5'-hydroxyl-kinase GRC3/NOL9